MELELGTSSFQPFHLIYTKLYLNGYLLLICNGYIYRGIAIAPIIQINISKSEGLEEKVVDTTEYRSRVSLDSNLEGNIKQ